MPDPTKRPDGPALMIAGPGQLHDEDLSALGRQVIAHYGESGVARCVVLLPPTGDAVAALREHAGRLALA